MRLVEKGEFRAPNDNGGGSMDDIDNIHKSFEKKPDDAVREEPEKSDEAPKEEPVKDKPAEDDKTE